MPYSPPDFNLTGSYWDPGHTPAVDPPDGSIVYQLYFSSRGFADVQPGRDDLWQPTVFARISVVSYNLYGPSLVGAIFSQFDTLAHTWYYRVRWWSHVHAGFPNEYVALLVEQCDGAGVAVPADR